MAGEAVVLRHVHGVHEAPKILWDLLGERDDTINISHRKMPEWHEHCRFIVSKPYALWYLIEAEGEFVGSVYLTHESEIGIFIFKRHHGKGYGAAAVKKLMSYAGKDRYLANINPRNTRSIGFFARLGFAPIQYTYEFRP